MKNIIFDFGGVLLEWNADNFYLSYFDNNKQLMNDFYEETGIQILNKEIDRGLSFDTALKQLANQFPQYESPIKLWKNAWHKMLGDKIDGSINILYELHESGYNLYGLTNWSAETFPYVYYKYDFFHLFKDIVVSGKEKMIKPEPQIYELCLTRNNLEAHQTIFIDDNIENITAAQQMGITGIHFKHAQQLCDDLMVAGVKLK